MTDQSEMADCKRSIVARSRELSAQLGVGDRQRVSTHFFRNPADDGISAEFAPYRRREDHNGIGKQLRAEVSYTPQPVQAGPLVLDQYDMPAAQPRHCQGEYWSKHNPLQATMGKLQTMLFAPD
jgi:hypothetical protein